MTSAGLYSTDELYRLLPEVHRDRDAAAGGVLRELAEVLTEEMNVIAESLEQMYDDQFVETAANWVIPYIGDLIGYRTLHGAVPDIASPRAEVANTIRYRRRKGTASMLEQLARDVTGWPARAVEFFELLATTQYMNHLRDHALATASLRGAATREVGGRFAAGAFDTLAHTAEMRRIPTRSGRYNIPNIGIFLFRLRASELARSPLVAADGSGRRYRIDPFGADRPIFSKPRTETDITHLAEPTDMPIPLTRRWTAGRLADYYGPGASLLLESETGTGVTALGIDDVAICDLSDDLANPGAWSHEPQPGDTLVAIDPVLGRVAYPAPAPTETRLATLHHGRAVLIGGGGYDRAESLRLEPDPASPQLVSGGGSLTTALNAVKAGGAVRITDSRRYSIPPQVEVTSGTVLVRAANRTQPLVARNDQIKLVMAPDTTLILDGLAIEGAPLVVEDQGGAGTRTIILRHCTLVPGIRRRDDGTPAFPDRASLIVLDTSAEIILDHCITGPIVAVEDSEVAARDSIIDAAERSRVAFAGRVGGTGTVTSAADRQVGDGLAAGGRLTLDESTAIGKVHATRLDVSNSIHLAARSGAADPWPAPVWAERRQVGCMRFSYVPPGSRTPREFQCVPRNGIPETVVPHHTSLRFGDPAYGQLRRATDPVIRKGADDESEMGVTHQLYQPQREANLRLRLDEYLRFGLEAGFFYAT